MRPMRPILVLTCSLTVFRVAAYSNGASSCEGPGAGHSGAIVSEGHGYEIQIESVTGSDASSMTWKAGTEFTLKLHGSTSPYFTGFLLQAKDTDTSLGIGTFSKPSGTQYYTVDSCNSRCAQACQGDAGSALTHSRDTSKIDLIVTWTAPLRGSGHVSFSNYWTKSFSENYFSYIAPSGVSLGVAELEADDSWDRASTLIVVVFTLVFMEATMLHHGYLFILSGLFCIGWNIFNGHSMGWRAFLQHKMLGAPPGPCWSNIVVRFITEDFCPQLAEFTVGQFSLLCISALAFIGGMFYKATDQDSLDDGSGWARATGWSASMLLVFLMLPTVHGKIWVDCFGLPFERALKFHRILSRSFVCMTYIHMIYVGDRFGWAIVFDIKPSGREPVYPVFGFISMLCASLIGATAMEPVRRFYFEIFFYSHRLLFPCVVISTVAHLWHSKSFFIMMLGSTLVYVLDRVLGSIRGKRVVEVESAELTCGITALNLNASGWNIVGGLKNTVGDYCFVQIPKVSKWEWHPFTISSAPGAKPSIHIKDMGPGTWSNKVKKLVELNAPFEMHLDGPYGSLQVNMDQYKTLVLVAGGIGITPMVCILGDILNKKKQIMERMAEDASREIDRNLFNDMILDDELETPDGSISSVSLQYSKLEQVVLVWCVQDPKMFGLFQHVLEEAASLSFVDLQLFVTQPGEGDGACTTVPYASGRPDMKAIMLDLAERQECMRKDRGGRAERVGAEEMACLVCGPAGLVHATQQEAVTVGAHFHKETFFF